MSTTASFVIDFGDKEYHLFKPHKAIRRAKPAVIDFYIKDAGFTGEYEVKIPASSITVGNWVNICATYRPLCCSRSY